MAAGSPVSQRNGRATTGRPGAVLQAALQADTVAADLAALKVDFNALLAKLRTAGVIAT